MQKIKIVADTASDIPQEVLEELGIGLLSIPIAVDGKGYYERKDFSMEEFYTILAGTSEIPVTSRVPAEDFMSCYCSALEQGYTHLIVVTINAGGSGTNATAQMVRDRFYEKVPGAREKLVVHVVDSASYSMGYGYPVMESARMAKAGKPAEEIIAYLEDWFASMEIYLGVYTLDYAKKSGRIGAAAAFVGDVLGLRPIIAMIDGATKTYDKVRGEKNMAPRLLQTYLERRAGPDAPVCVVCGQDKEYGQELARLIEKETGVLPGVYTAGASIVINAGPRLLAVVVKGKRR